MDVLKVIVPTVLTFLVGIIITPFFTRFFYAHKMWKGSPRSKADTSSEFAKIHNTENELKTPRVGGIIIWFSVLITILFIFILSVFYPKGLFGGEQSIFNALNFFSRSQTLVPLGAFFLSAFIGLADDFIQIYGRGVVTDALIYRKVKIALVSLIAISIALWFYFKLDFFGIYLPFNYFWNMGFWFIPFFVLVVLATFSTSVIDGIDGLAGGVLASCFTAYAIIAFIGNQYDISALAGAIAGGILAFLWFNIPPARFYMGETGMLSLTVTLSVISFLTNTVYILPIIAFPLVATSLSVIIQLIGYKYFDKKRVFLVAPIHHHFQALGWPREKVVMRYWIVSVISAISGVIIFIITN